MKGLLVKPVVHRNLMQMMKAVIRLPSCPGCSDPLLATYITVNPLYTDI